MKRFLKGLVIALLALMIVGGGVYAYTAITVTSDIEVLEPISITAVAGDGTFDFNSMTWNIGQIYPLDAKSLSLDFNNDASGTITIWLLATPSNLDGGNLTFYFDSPVIDVPAGGKATVTLTANTTQSLAPGAYSTIITVDR